jgi:xanthine dehydrogenase accessory factor
LDLQAALDAAENGVIPVLVDPMLTCLHTYRPNVLVDARMLKLPAESSLDLARLVIGLGPGFRAGENCHAVIETKRGPNLGRVYWQGQAEDDTGLPETVGSQRDARVIRAPVSGTVAFSAQIGDLVTVGEVIGQVGEELVTAAFTGVLRGAIHNGLWVEKGTKVGDLDPRQSSNLCFCLSDKALAIGGGVLEAVLSRPDLREGMWA